MGRTSLRQRYTAWALRHVGFFPAYIGARIKVPVADPAGGRYVTRMRLSLLNRNALGTHFGGSLYSMCDPFFVLILMEQLGAGYEIWDKSATIDFLRPGRGTVTASFVLTPDEVAAMKAEADAGRVVEPRFTVEVVDESGRAVARVHKTLHVRKRRAGSASRGGSV